ncbi:MAG: hypothetical protein WAU11_16930 [Ignavibacteriaceae bacterium]
MSLNRNVIFLLIISFFIIISCSEKTDKIPKINYQDKSELLDIVKKHYNKDAEVALGGMFDETGKEFIASGVEINNSDEWGIKFTFLEKSNDEFIELFETELLNGSFKESMIDKIKLSSFDYELVYYSSQSYFMGSGGGEVFSYIIDLELKQVYYAHLVVESESAIYLYLSENTQRRELINFFNMTLRKDYPGLQIVSDDIIID